MVLDPGSVLPVDIVFTDVVSCLVAMIAVNASGWSVVILRMVLFIVVACAVGASWCGGSANATNVTPAPAVAALGEG